MGQTGALKQAKACTEAGTPTGCANPAPQNETLGHSWAAGQCWTWHGKPSPGAEKSDFTSGAFCGQNTGCAWITHRIPVRSKPATQTLSYLLRGSNHQHSPHTSLACLALHALLIFGVLAVLARYRGKDFFTQVSQTDI